MTRTIIHLDSDEKAWLERTAKAAGVPTTTVVREAIRRMRQQEEMTFEQVLQQTSGLRSGQEGLAYQRGLREEWW
jgi:predicted transcriptional regulator